MVEGPLGDPPADGEYGPPTPPGPGEPGGEGGVGEGPIIEGPAPVQPYNVMDEIVREEVR
ncbi:hypothetical protein ABZ456_29015 [Streptomyces sp. NPDC005776]|uniref:hypothetical protein n=1 Tax=Streptomyces sp. NPDC005776 TaxID=3154676 RepID=UPI0033D0352B